MVGFVLIGKTRESARVVRLVAFCTWDRGGLDEEVEVVASRATEEEVERGFVMSFNVRERVDLAASASFSTLGLKDKVVAAASALLRETTLVQDNKLRVQRMP